LAVVAALIAAAAAEKVGLLGFQELLNDETRRRLDKGRDDVLFAPDAVGEQSVELLADEHGRGWPPHWPEPPCH
jgi:hypothetical protein